MPHAVALHSFRHLDAIAAVGIVDGGLNERGVAEKQAGESHGAVLPALDVVDRHVVQQNDVARRRQEELVGNDLAIGFGDCVPQQIGALRGGDQPDGLVERLR